jgi:2-polyprenyl-3-methyl-5-hydroxy-6-metoxy-1,4-benzoquinol methylase
MADKRMHAVQDTDLHMNHVSKCAICKSKKNYVVLSGVRDNVLHAVNYHGDILKCSECGHSFLSPVISIEHLHFAYKNYYTQNQENLPTESVGVFAKYKEYYSLKFKNHTSKKGRTLNIISLITPFSKFFLARAVRFLEPSLKSKPPTLLDIGCGNGDFLIRSNYCGYISTGIDFDPRTIDIARSRGLDACVSEVHSLSQSVTYNAITLSHVIEHIADPVSLLEEIFKRLKPGGYFYIATPNFNSAGRRTFGNDWRGCDVPRHMHFFDSQVLGRLLSDVGFTKIHQVYDLQQSIGIIRSSLELKYPSGVAFLKLLSSIKLLLQNRFYLKKNLDVIVFKCHKPHD